MPVVFQTLDWALFLPFSVACLVALALVLTKSWHGRFSMDGSVGVQKFHTTPTPRIGGVALVSGAIAAVMTLDGEAQAMMALIVACGLPAFVAGLVEDVTKSVSPLKRLVATIAAGLAFGVFAGAAADFTALWWWPFPEALWSTALALALIGVGVGGVANAVNIVDGFHGLASGALVIMFCAFGVIAGGQGDAALALICFSLAACSAGFLVVNFPLGKIFLGDAGAYFGGFALAAVAVLLVARNDGVSPFVALLVVFYPVFETLFSILRKAVRDGHHPGQPDGVHLHMLVSRSFGRRIANAVGIPGAKNAITGALMWSQPLLCAGLAVASQGYSKIAILGCALYAGLYVSLYVRVSLQQPRMRRGSSLARRFGRRERVGQAAAR